MPSSKKIVQIEKVVFGGDGLARDEGQVIFVPFTLAGETVEVEITAQAKRFQRGKLLQVLKPSPERVTPPCPYFGACGGCQLQHMSYSEQLSTKQAQLEELFPHVLPIEPAPKTLEYRKRIKLRHEGDQIGYTAIDNHSFVAIDRCLLFSNLPLKGQPLFKNEGPFLIDDLKITLAEGAFCQNFPEQSVKMYQYIKQLIKESAPHKIDDLYCGVGITSLLASPLAEKIIGIELSGEAVRLARQNAAANNVKNVAFFAKRAEEAQIQGDLVLINPPRTGADQRVLAKLEEVETIIYTSCNPATLARDIKRLPHHRLVSCKPFDMFPQTAHVEVVAHLKKSNCELQLSYASDQVV